MKPNVVNRSVALSMAVLILMSGSGISLNFHFCGGHLASFAIWNDAPSCLELIAQKHCSKKSDKKSDEQEDTKECPPGCCDDRGISLDADFDLVNSALPYYKPGDTNEQTPAVSQTIQKSLKSDLQLERQFLTYRPPPDNSSDLFSFFQTWRL